MQPNPAEPPVEPRRVIAAFAGPGVLEAGHLLRVLEALELRKALYHKKIPALVEVAREQEVLDHGGWVGAGDVTRREVLLRWEELHREPPLSTEGLAGLREFLREFPAGARGLRVALGYAFPGREPERLELAAFPLDGGRYEVRLAADAARVLDPADPRKARANALMLADLAEAIYDVLAPPYGALRVDGGVLPDQVPTRGWGYYSAALIERAGRAAVEELAGRCYKSWELADGGWFLAPAAMDDPQDALVAARAGLFGPLRHLPLERMAATLAAPARAGGPGP